MGGAICNGSPGRWKKIKTHCPWCDGKRTAIVRELFSGYGSHGICGWCGSEYQDGDLWPREMSEDRRDRNRDLVAKVIGHRADEPTPRGLRLPEVG
jgi:hypothetical protein